MIYETRDGEHEYENCFMLKAKNMKHTEEKAKVALKEKIIGYGYWVDDE